jgi:tRNA-binding protein
MISYEDFEKVDIRSGTIVEVHEFPEARKPAYQLLIDFGPTIGRKQSSAQITHRYTKEQLLGKQILAVVNFPKKKIAGFSSEVLVLGLSDTNDTIVLVEPNMRVPNGQRLH